MQSKCSTKRSLLQYLNCYFVCALEVNILLVQSNMLFQCNNHWEGSMDKGGLNPSLHPIASSSIFTQFFA